MQSKQKFLLDYDKTKNLLRKNWRSLIRMELYEDVFNDTYLHYLENYDSIPNGMKHVTWFNNQMLNQRLNYAEFRDKHNATRSGSDVPVRSNGCVSTMDYLPDEDNNPEEILEQDQEQKQHYYMKYPYREGQHECFDLLRQGYSVQETADVLGCSYQWVRKLILQENNNEPNN